MSNRARIIPARAGFTYAPIREGARVEDHPRSRGVYCDCGRFVAAQKGSSPLARGLHVLEYYVL